MRGRKVILDRDLAALYGVAVKRLNEQIKRKVDRFPSDFVFRVRKSDLRSQIATSKVLQGDEGRRKPRKGGEGRGGRRDQPLAFAEHGAVMAASVLNSTKAVEMSVFVVRLRENVRSTDNEPEDHREAERLGTESRRP